MLFGSILYITAVSLSNSVFVHIVCSNILKSSNSLKDFCLLTGGSSLHIFGLLRRLAGCQKLKEEELQKHDGAGL